VSGIDVSDGQTLRGIYAFCRHMARQSRRMNAPAAPPPAS
jgi:hypothetical protein